MNASVENMRAELQAAVNNAAPGRAVVDDLCSASVALFDVDGAAVSTVHQGTPQWTVGFSDESSRRLDEHQFTFGEGPGIDAVAARRPVLVPDLGSAAGSRWPTFAEAALADGIRAVFALPVSVADRTVGALDLFRSEPGPLHDDALAGAAVAAELAARSLLHLFTSGALDSDCEHDGVTRPASLGASDTGEAGHGSRGSGRGWRSDAMDLNRVEVYQATGILIHQLGVGPGEAVVRLRAHAMATRRTVSDVAYDVIERRLTLHRDDRSRHHPGNRQGPGSGRSPDDRCDDERDQA